MNVSESVGKKLKRLFGCEKSKEIIKRLEKCNAPTTEWNAEALGKFIGEWDEAVAMLKGRR